MVFRSVCAKFWHETIRKDTVFSSILIIKKGENTVENHPQQHREPLFAMEKSHDLGRLARLSYPCCVDAETLIDVGHELQTH